MSMETKSPRMELPEDDKPEFVTISKMMVAFAELYDEPAECSTPGDLPCPDTNGLITSPHHNGQRVARDGPGGNKKGPRVPPVMSLSTMDGGLYVFDHGKMVQEGKFEYHHITPTITSVLAINETKVYLRPDIPGKDHPDDAELVKQKDQHLEPGNEKAQLTGVRYRQTLALSYTDDPKDAKLEVISEQELKTILDQIEKGKIMVPKITPTIHILGGGDGLQPNNLALYFYTPQYYYWLYVDSTNNPPVLTTKAVKNTPDYKPKLDLLQRVQFIERPPSSVRAGHDTPDGAQLSVEGDENGDASTEVTFSLKNLKVSEGSEEKEESTDPSTPSNSEDSKPNNEEQTPEKIAQNEVLDKMPNGSTHIENEEKHELTPSDKENQALNGSAEILAEN